MIVGDFNVVTCIEEVSNQSSFLQQRCIDFIEGLVDHGLLSHKLTWMRGRDKNTFRGSHLDCALCLVEWIKLMENVEVSHLPSLNCNHSPLLVTIGDINKKRKGHGFKY